MNRFFYIVLFLFIVSSLLSSSYSASAQCLTAAEAAPPPPPIISIISPTTTSPACFRQSAVYIPGVTVQVVFIYTMLEPLNLTIKIYNATVTAAEVAQVAGITPGVSITQAVNVTVWNTLPVIVVPNGIYDLAVTMFDIYNHGGTEIELNAVILDRTIPVIWNQTRTPSGSVTADQPVTVSANVTDALCGVQSVRLEYNVTNSPLTRDFPMSLNSTTGLYEYTIPEQQSGTVVKYKIKAYDNAGNIATDDNGGQYYTYAVIVPEFPSLLILSLIMLVSLPAAIAYSARKREMPL